MRVLNYIGRICVLVPIWLDAIIAVEPSGILYLICNSKSFKQLFTIL